MIDRYTDASKRVFRRARIAAERKGRDELDAQLVLLGLLDVEPSVALDVLDALGADRARVRSDLEEQMPVGRRAPGTCALPFTADARRCLERGYFEAQTLGHRLIGTGHLLLGLCASESLRSLLSRFPIDRMRAEVHSRHGDDAP